MTKYRIIKGRNGNYHIEHRYCLWFWKAIPSGLTYKACLEQLQRELDHDAEGLPKIVLER